MLVLFTDSDCDMTPVEANKWGYHIISMPYIMDNKEIFPYEDFQEFNFKNFYDILRTGVVPKTCAINSEKYKSYFEPFFKEGNDILYVHFSSKMSGTFNSMKIALDELKELYPERKFYEIDTKGITICSLAIAREVGRLYKEGKSIDEILSWADKEVDKYAVYFYADDLKFFKKSGRISNFSGTMGDIFGIHPIIFMDSDGLMKSISKARGRIPALKKMMQYVEKLQDDIKSHQILIAHTDAPNIVETLIKMLKEKYGQDLNIDIIDVNPTSGAHCGPSCVGICFHAIHR